jgi:hypothetical protein
VQADIQDQVIVIWVQTTIQVQLIIIIQVIDPILCVGLCVTLRGGVSVTRMIHQQCGVGSLCDSERWCECDKDDPSAVCVALGDSER